MEQREAHRPGAGAAAEGCRVVRFSQQRLKVKVPGFSLVSSWIPSPALPGPTPAPSAEAVAYWGVTNTYYYSVEGNWGVEFTNDEGVSQVEFLVPGLLCTGLNSRMPLQTPHLRLSQSPSDV